MLRGDDESNCKHKIAASVGTERAGWRRGLDRLLSMVPSLNITFPVSSGKHTRPLQNCYNLTHHSCVWKAGHPCGDYYKKKLKEKKKEACVRVVRLTVFTSQHPFTKDTADKPLQGEKGCVQSTFSPAASSSFLPHMQRVSHAHTQSPRTRTSLLQRPSFAVLRMSAFYILSCLLQGS